MGTISEKLTYLNETKGKIKDSINLTGAGITDQDTFRSYETKLKDGLVDIINNGVDTLYENFPKVAQTGEEPTLNGVYEAPMRVDLNGNTEQTTYTGKNLCSSAELQSAANVRFYIDKKIEKTLTISFTTNESLNNNSLYLSATNTLATTITAAANTKATATFTLSDEQYSAIQNATNPYFLLFKSGANFTVPNDAQIENGSTYTSLEPYVGGTSSPNPDYPQDIRVVKGDNTIKVTGKNLFDKNNVNTLNAYISLGNSKITSSNADKCLYIPIKSNTTYTISKVLSSRFVIGCADELPVVNTTICNPISSNQATDTTYTITSGNNSQYLVVFYYATADTLTEQEILDSIQIEYGSTSTTYQPYQEQTYPLNLGTTELCKIGDYKDEIRKSTGKNLFDIPNKTGSRGNNTFTALNQEITINSNTSGTESAFYLNDVSQVSQYLATTYGNAMDFNMTGVGGTYTLTLFFNYIPTNNVTIALFTNKRTIQKGKSDWENTQCKWNITLDNDEYIKSVQFYTSGSNVFSNFKITAQLEQGSQATDYEPFGKVWYLKKNIGKVVLDGSEDWGLDTTKTLTQVFHNTTTINKLPTNDSSFNNYFAFSNPGDVQKLAWGGANHTELYIAIEKTTASTVEQFKTWLSTHNTIVYYVLATPTYEEITDTTLIEQLEDLKTTKSVEGQTNITQTNEELPFILDVSGLKKD